MCEPATLMMMATAAQAVGTVVSSVQQHKALKRREDVARQNQALASQRAADALQRGREEASKESLRKSQLLSQQRAAAAANGIDVDFGSTALFFEDTKTAGAEDVRTIVENSEREARDGDIQAYNFGQEAFAAKEARSGLPLKTAIDLTGTIVGGATQAKLFGGAGAVKKAPKVVKSKLPEFNF